MQSRLELILSSVAQELWLEELLQTDDTPEDPLSMLLHIQLTAYEAIRKLPENLRKTVGAEFVATEELFAAFFMDEDEGREEWNKMPEDCKLEYN